MKCARLEFSGCRVKPQRPRSRGCMVSVETWGASRSQMNRRTTNREDCDPGGSTVSSRVELQHCQLLLPRMAEHERALVRSRSGPAAGMSLSAIPSNPQLGSSPSCFGSSAVEAPAPSPSPSVDLPQVQMWPSTRLSWPSSSRLCTGRSVGGVGSPWRVSRPAFAGKRWIVCPRVCWCATWTLTFP